MKWLIDYNWDETTDRLRLKWIDWSVKIEMKWLIGKDWDEDDEADEARSWASLWATFHT